ncbi:hypothetical protein T4B_10522 [Trichinella pseudospiralis]|nr:hypothetical protein T4B_10522 [Trichinella pseudospiralis]
MVPPILPVLCSGISITTGAEVSCENSVEFASFKPRTLRANSITAHCMPKQMPKNGTFLCRAQRQAATLPSIPRSPKPPGTKTPSQFSNICNVLLYNSGSFNLVTSSRSSELTIDASSRRLHAKAACSSALYTDA